MSVDRRVCLKGVVALVIGVATLGLLFAGVATATIPMSTTGQYVACYRTSSGAMRMIDVQKGGRCYSWEKKIAWGPSYVWKGTYKATSGYNAGAVVLLGGSSYVARLTVPAGQAPAGNGTTYWGLLAARGADGQPGAPGTSMLLGPNRLIAEVWVSTAGLLAYSRSTNGAAIQSSKYATGRYVLRLPGFQTAGSAQQAVQVTAVGGNVLVNCHSLGVAQAPTYVDVFVGCANQYDSTDADSGFMLQVTS